VHYASQVYANSASIRRQLSQKGNFINSNSTLLAGRFPGFHAVSLL
jgi:hypothetical protein